MTFIKYVKVDAKDGTPTTLHPSRHGSVDPVNISQVVSFTVESVPHTPPYEHLVLVGATEDVVKVGGAILKVYTKKEEESILLSLQESKLSKLNQDYNSIHTTLTSDYPEREQSTFDLQRREAKEVLAGGSDTLWIDSAAAERGITREALAESISSRDTEFRVKSGTLSGKRQAQRDYILSETDITTLAKFRHTFETVE